MERANFHYSKKKDGNHAEQNFITGRIIFIDISSI